MRLPFTVGVKMKNLLVVSLFLSSVSFADVQSISIDTSLINNNFTELDQSISANASKIDSLDSRVSVNDSLAFQLGQSIDSVESEISYIDERITELESGDQESQECKLVDAWGQDITGWIDIDCSSNTISYDTGSEVVDITEYLNLSKGFGISSIDGEKYKMDLKAVKSGSLSSCYSDFYYFDSGLKVITTIGRDSETNLSKNYYAFNTDGSISFWSLTSDKSMKVYNCSKSLEGTADAFSKSDLTYQGSRTEDSYDLKELLYTVPALPVGYSYPLKIVQ